MPEHYGQGGRTRPHGPYGTNEGDKWFCGEAIQAIARKDGLTAIIEMMRGKDGKLEEHLYTTDDPEIIKEAREGTDKYMNEESV
jgi:hypothetical protein